MLNGGGKSARAAAILLDQVYKERQGCYWWHHWWHYCCYMYLTKQASYLDRNELEAVLLSMQKWIYNSRVLHTRYDYFMVPWWALIQCSRSSSVAEQCLCSSG